MAGPNDPLNPYNLATGSTGTQPGAPVAPAPLKRGYTNADTGVTGGYFGKLQTDSLEALWKAAQNDPKRAYQILRMALGQNGPDLGPMAGMRGDLYGKAFSAALNLGGMNGGGLEEAAGDFLANGVQANNLGAYTNKLGRSVLDQDFTGVNFDDFETMLRLGLLLQSNDMGGMGQRVGQGRLDNLLYDIWGKDMEGGLSGEGVDFAGMLQNSPYQKAMTAFGTP